MTESVWFWTIGLAIIVLIAVTISRRYGRRVTERQIISSQQIVNDAMRLGVTALQAKQLLSTEERVDINSTLVANVWGHDVMAFEFALPAQNRHDPHEIRHELNLALAEYARTHELKSAADDRPALLVTDVWYDNSWPLLHIDVTHIVNEETAAYLRDLRRLNQPAL